MLSIHGPNKDFLEPHSCRATIRYGMSIRSLFYLFLKWVYINLFLKWVYINLFLKWVYINLFLKWVYINVIFFVYLCTMVDPDSTHHFFRNACTKSGSLRFSQFSGCWLILSVYILMSFDFPFGKLFGVRLFCYYPYLPSDRTTYCTFTMVV